VPPGRARCAPDIAVSQGPSACLALVAYLFGLAAADIGGAGTLGAAVPIAAVTYFVWLSAVIRPCAARLPMRYGYFNGAEGLLINSIILVQNCSAASAFACSLLRTPLAELNSLGHEQQR
jgi:hypothetical protein